MYCHEEIALKVAAFALQAEKGNYDALEKRHGYFRPEDYLPEKVRREGHVDEGEHSIVCPPEEGGYAHMMATPLSHHYSCSSDRVDHTQIV